MTNKYIKFFLRYGYFPRKQENTINFNNYNYDYDTYSLDENAIKAANLFIDNVEKLFDKSQNHLVPLSGGLDSRTILFTLLKFTEAKNIYSYSFGAKGTLDYEIASSLAKSLGINHIAFDLQQYKYDLEDLIYHSNAVNQQTFLFHNAPLRQVDRIFKDFTIWSGILGDAVAGSAMPQNKTNNLKVATQNYLNKKTYAKDSILNDNYEDFIFLSEFDTKSKLTNDEKIIFTERYHNSYKPHICPGINNYKEPFLNSEWTDFMFNLPNNLKENKILFYKMLPQIDKDIFDFPIKNKLGCNFYDSNFKVFSKRVINKIKAKFNNVPMGTNYFDFNIKFNLDNSFSKLIIEQMKDLNSRNIIDFLNITKIISDYQRSEITSELVKTLVALEIHLKNGKKLPNSMDEIC